jgi:hypothetical protein
VAQQPTQVVASPVMGEQQSANQETNQQIQKLNNELKKQQQQFDKEKKNSRIKGWMMTGGGLIGGIILSAGLYLGVAAPNHDQTSVHDKPQTQQTNVQSGGGSKADNKAKLPADRYEKGDVIKNVKTPDGKTDDLVVDDLKKNDNTLLVHKKADSDKELDYNKEKDHYDFYSVPVEGFDKK